MKVFKDNKVVDSSHVKGQHNVAVRTEQCAQALYFMHLYAILSKHFVLCIVLLCMHLIFFFVN